MDSITLPKEYGYVLLTATLTTLIAWYHTINASSYRKASKIRYPNPYASAAEAAASKDAYLFNCAQRAHGNFLEHQPSMLVGLMVGGLRYPVVSAVVGAAWCAARVGYMRGYCRRDREEGRGRLGWVVVGSLLEVGLMGLSGVVGWRVVMG